MDSIRRHTVIVLLICACSSYAQISFPGASNPGSFTGQSQRPTRPVPDKTTTISNQGGGGNSCNCLSRCPSGTGQAKHGCITEQRNQGTCCINQEGAVTTRTGFLGSASAVNVPPAAVDSGMNLGQQASSRILEQNRNFKQTGQYLKKGSPARAHAYFFGRRRGTIENHREAYLLAKASASIAKSQKLSPAQASPTLKQIAGVSTKRPCRADTPPRCNQNDRFRTIDGTCNNLRNPLFGKSETALSRLGFPTYDDGVMEPRTISVDGSPLKNVREVSNTVLLDLNNPSPVITLNVMQWAQFMDHDLTHVPFEDMDGEAIMCCQNGKILPNAHEQCFPIRVSPQDGFFRNFNEQCINFVRSMLALRPQCAFGPAEQVNALTHWVDGSMVYGSTNEEAEAVRQRGSAFLKVSNNDLLPTDNTIDCEARTRAPCFVAGDSRSNEQPGLTVLHTILVREHNRIARELSQLNPQASGDQIFEEARRIVIAQIQHITYTEWLPIVVGDDLMQRYGLNGPTRYRPDINPALSNEFATAAFRFGHSLVQGVYILPSASGRTTSLPLRDVFNDPGRLQKEPELVNSFIRALTSQPSQGLDNFVTEDLSNHLFQTRGSRFGMDLMSLNIQRGRDHGISTYADMRRHFGTGRADSFADLLNTTPPDLIIRLQSVYKYVDDADLWSGGMTEKSVPNGLLGPTFGHIVAQQFSNLRHGDRFFYDVQGQPGSFTPAQLREIRKSSMSRMFCDNSHGQIQGLQRNGFLMASSRGNPVTPCQQLPKIDLRKWS